jgi:hypothetical protein
LTKIDAKAAEETMRLLEELGQLQAELEQYETRLE